MATALVLAHEVTHIAGGGEEAAYVAETQLALDMHVSPRFSQFVTRTASGDVIDSEAIRRFISTAYDGWYGASALTRWKEDSSGTQIIEFGTEQKITRGWVCLCDKEVYRNMLKSLSSFD